MRICTKVGEGNSTEPAECIVFTNYAELGKYLDRQGYKFRIIVLHPADTFGRLDIEDIKKKCGECDTYMIIIWEKDTW